LNWNSKINVNNPFFEQIQKLKESPQDLSDIKPLSPVMTTSCESDKTLKNESIEQILLKDDDVAAMKPEIESMQPL
jgi:hypothetical protein